MHITGPKDGPPCKVGVALTDVCTGLYAHGAIMAALVQRGKDGKGQKIDCNLLATQVATLVPKKICCGLLRKMSTYFSPFPSST